MSTPTIDVELPDGRTVRLGQAGPDATLAGYFAEAGFALNTRCSGRGLCKGCRVLDAGGKWLLACQTQPVEGMRLRVPASSLLSHPPSVVDDFVTGVPAGNDPLFTGGPLGVAIDIGTTTVAVLLVDLGSGAVLARASALNAQVASGDNVLTRIQLCQSDKTQISRLQSAFWEDTFAPLFVQLLKHSGAKPEDVAGAAMAGNTTMLHLACGKDPTPMGMVPFRPEFLEQQRFEGKAIGAPQLPTVVFLPGISAYVGADIAAGAICCGAEYSQGWQLLVDVGTNGEMLLAGKDGIMACATAAGPAFEGSGLLSGMRAADGVAGKFSCGADGFRPQLVKIGSVPGAPLGIAGSAYVDFLAEGRRAGLLEANGRFCRAFVERHRDYFREEENGLAFLPDPHFPHVRIGEVDVALLLQAKAAIAAGMETLLAGNGIVPADIGCLHLAGGFGLHLDIPNAIACGLLPGFAPSQIHAVGNTSLGGAYLALLDRTLLAEMENLRLATRTIELNLDPGFEDRYLDNLSL